MKLFQEEGMIVLDFEGADVTVDLPKGIGVNQALTDLAVVRHASFLIPPSARTETAISLTCKGEYK